MRIYWRRACLAVGAAQRVGTGQVRTVRVKRATSGPYRKGEVPQFREVEITRYSLKSKGEEAQLTVEEVNASREWLAVALRRFVVGRPFPAPAAAGTFLKLLT